jgi:hypothetical protein
MSPESVVIVREARPADRRRPVPDEDGAWKWVGWFGLVLATVGLTDFALTWLPMELGRAEWEFGTIAASFSGLPLVTMGFAGLLGSALARGVRWQLVAMTVVLLGMALFLVGALVVFVLVVPVALGVVEGAARTGILKAIARTLVLGVVFVAAYVAAGIGSLRQARKS